MNPPLQVRLVTAFGGTCLRANGGTPPWKNSVTHDVPSAKRSRILWDVEAVEIPENEELTDDLFGSEIGSEVGSPVSIHSSSNSPMVSIKKVLAFPFNLFSTIIFFFL